MNLSVPEFLAVVSSLVSSRCKKRNTTASLSLLNVKTCRRIDLRNSLAREEPTSHLPPRKAGLYSQARVSSPIEAADSLIVLLKRLVLVSAIRWSRSIGQRSTPPLLMCYRVPVNLSSVTRKKGPRRVSAALVSRSFPSTQQKTAGGLVATLFSDVVGGRVVAEVEHTRSSIT